MSYECCGYFFNNTSQSRSQCECISSCEVSTTLYCTSRSNQSSELPDKIRSWCELPRTGVMSAVVTSLTTLYSLRSKTWLQVQFINTEQRFSNNVSEFTHSNQMTKSYYSSPKHKESTSIYSEYNFLTSVALHSII